MNLPYNYYTSKCDNYCSEIAFINTENPLIRKTVFFIESKNIDYLKTSFYVDNDKQDLRVISNMYRNHALSDDYIERIQPITRYYSYIKVIRDENNPQLEGKNMLFYFGVNIYNKIEKYFSDNKKFNHIFKFRMYKKYDFPICDDSFFTEKHCEIYEDFNIESQLNFKVYSRLKLDRRNKLENIFKK